MPDNCTKFVLVAEPNRPIHVWARFYPDASSLETVTKNYRLAEAD